METGSQPAPRAKPIPVRSSDGERDDSVPVWAFIWTLFAFKVATVGLMLYHMRAWESDLVIAATTWYWFPVLGVLGAAPLLFRYRLRKVRARRQQLMRSEWMLTSDDGVEDGAAARRP